MSRGHSGSTSNLAQILRNYGVVAGDELMIIKKVPLGSLLLHFLRCILEQNPINNQNCKMLVKQRAGGRPWKGTLGMPAAHAVSIGAQHVTGGFRSIAHSLTCKLR